MWLGVLTALGFDVRTVRSQAWKGAFCLQARPAVPSDAHCAELCTSLFAPVCSHPLFTADRHSTRKKAHRRSPSPPPLSGPVRNERALPPARGGPVSRARVRGRPAEARRPHAEEAPREGGRPAHLVLRVRFAGGLGFPLSRSSQIATRNANACAYFGTSLGSQLCHQSALSPSLREARQHTN